MLAVVVFLVVEAALAFGLPAKTFLATAVFLAVVVALGFAGAAFLGAAVLVVDLAAALGLVAVVEVFAALGLEVAALGLVAGLFLMKRVRNGKMRVKQIINLFGGGRFSSGLRLGSEFNSSRES